MYVENEKIRKRIDEIQEELEKENNCKTYSQILEKLSNNELLHLCAEKIFIGKDFVYNREDAIKQLISIHENEFNQSFGFYQGDIEEQIENEWKL